MTLLAASHAILAGNGIPHCVIGAAAMAVHGVARSTFDIDLLVTDRKALEESLWSLEDTTVEVRVGDAEDPLAGLVRLERRGERNVNVVVGRHAWQTRAISRAEPTSIEDVVIPVVTAADLVLLKLFAGGSQDLWDIEQLLAGPAARPLRDAVDASIEVLPRRARDAWDHLTAARRD